MRGCRHSRGQELALAAALAIVLLAVAVGGQDEADEKDSGEILLYYFMQQVHKK